MATTDIISTGDFVTVSEDYPVREFAGQTGEVLEITPSTMHIECESIVGEMFVFANHVRLADIHREF